MDLLLLLLSVVRGGLSLAGKISDHIEQKRLVEAGEDKAVRKALEESRAKISDALDARRDARRKFERDGLPKHYKYFRD